MKNDYAKGLIIIILLLLLLVIAKKTYDFFRAKKLIQSDPELNEEIMIGAEMAGVSYGRQLNKTALSIAANSI